MNQSRIRPSATPARLRRREDPLARERSSLDGSQNLFPGSSEELHLSCELDAHDPRGFPWAGSAAPAPAVGDRSRLCRYPGRLWRIAGISLAAGESSAVAVTSSVPPGIVGGVGPAG